VLTLAVTLWNQAQQQRESQRSKDDEAWRSAISEFKSASDKRTGIAGPLSEVRLKPFLKSPIYGDQANQLARLLLPHIADVEGFKDLFDSVKWQSLSEMASVDRSINRYYDYLTSQSKSLEGERSAAVSASGVAAAGSSALPSPPAAANQRVSSIDSRKATLDEEQSHVLKEILYVSRRMSENAHAGALSTKNLDLEDTWLNGCDLSRLDLSGAILTNSLLQNVDLTGARLTSVTEIDNLSINATAWWNAGEISPPLLRALMDFADPGLDGGKISGWPTKEQYIAKVVHLCELAKMDCPEGKIKFTVAPLTTTAATTTTSR
jgi:hypothetical protein